MRFICILCLVAVLLPSVLRAEAHGVGKKALPHSATLAIEDMPRVGLNTGDMMDAAALNNAGASGAKVGRVSVLWKNIEPGNTDPSHYNWTQTDSIIARIAARGLLPEASILGCPIWACPVEDGPLNAGMDAEIAQFMGAIAARYSQPPYNLHYWEMWNEPDAAGGPGMQNGWGMHPDGYAAMLAAVYPAVKAADPNAVVMTGGLSYDFWFHQGGPFNPDFLPGILAHGAAQHLDALGFHYYTENANGWTNIALKAADLRAAMLAQGVDLPLVCTETGLTSSATFGSSEARQARYLAQMEAHAASAGVRSVYWYLNRDFVAQLPGWEIFANDGLTRLDDTRKLSFTAMQVFSNEIGSGLYLRQLDASDGITGTLEGYRFASTVPMRQISEVWNNGTQQTTLTIPAEQAVHLQGVISLLGQPVSTQPGPGGAVLVPVGPDPVYIRWQAPRFPDVPYESWMYPYVEYLASREYISGYADSTFRPGNNATRGQFSKMVALGMSWPITTTGGPHFRDVPTTQAFYPYIETAYAHNIISGYACGGVGEPCPGTYYRPNSNILRAQTAKLVVLAKGWPLATPGRATFSDVPVGSTYFAYVETAASHGVISGYADGTFKWSNAITRAQISKILALALQQP